MRLLSRPLFLLILLVTIAASTLHNGINGWLRLYMSARGFAYSQIRTPSFTVAFHDTGESGLPVLVLVHGFMTDGALNWFGIAPQLKGRFRMIIPDLLNANEANVLHPDYRFERESLLLKELLTALEVKNPDIVFFSLSCLLAPYFKEQAGLILLAPPPLSPAVLQQALHELPGKNGNWLGASLFHDPPPGYQLAAWLLAWHWKTYVPALRRTLATCPLDWAKHLEGTPPELVFMPDDDRFFPSAFGEAERFFPSTARVPLHRAGHAATWDAASQIVLVLQQRREAPAYSPH